MTVSFGSVDGSEIELFFQKSFVGYLQMSSKPKEHFHLSKIEFHTTSGWIALSAENVRKATLSSDNLPKPEGSINRFLSNNGFFETRIESKPSASFTLIPFETDGIRIHNREDGLWERANALALKIEFSDRSALSFNFGERGADVGYLLRRVRYALGVTEHTVKIFLEEIENILLAIPIWTNMSSDNFSKLIPAVQRYAQNLLSWVSQHSGTFDAIQETNLRLLLMFCACAKYDESYKEENVVTEFVARLLLFGPELAFKRLKRNKPGLLNNRLYELLNEALQTHDIEHRVGKLLFSGHGIFRRQNRRPEIETFGFVHSVCSILEQSGVQPFICYGALLGMVREHRLLPHDDDVDLVGIIASEDAIEETFQKICENVESAGFCCTRNRTNTRNIPFVTINDPRNPVYLDVFFGWRNHQKPVLLSLPMQKVEYSNVPYSCFDGGEMHTVSGHEIRFPSNPVKFLELRYGKNWGTPDYLFRIREG